MSFPKTSPGGKKYQFPKKAGINYRGASSPPSSSLSGRRESLTSLVKRLINQSAPSNPNASYKLDARRGGT